MKTSTLALAVFAPMVFAARFHERRTHPEPEMPAMEHPVAAPAAPAEHPAPPAVVKHPAEVVEAPAKVVHPGVTKESKTEIIIIWHNAGAGAETTTVNEKVTVTQTITKGGEVIETKPAEAAQHTVTVGGPGGLVYQPEELHDIPIGDTVVFEFLSQNHTVSQSGFDTPCDAMEGGMDSGFMANPNNTVSPPPQVAMQVMVDTPLWFYCKQGNHCGQGMVFSINPSAEKTHAKFKEMAIQQKGDGKLAPIQGGEPAAPAASKPAEAAPPAAAPPAGTDAAAAPPEATGVVPGKGTVAPDGSCVCHVSCAAGAFPAAAQGINSFGGMAGAMPYNLGGIS